MISEHRLNDSAFNMTSMIMLFLMLATGASALWFSIHNSYSPYTPDSAYYIEQARSVISGKGFQSRFYGLDEIGKTTRADPLFSPGYSIVIATGTELTGVSPEMVAPWVNRIAMALLPVIVFLSFRLVVGVYYAACIGTLTVLTPGILKWGQLALSDILSLALVIASFGMTLVALSDENNDRPIWMTLLGGLISGFAYLTRNANLAFIAASSVTIALLLILSPKRERLNKWKLSFAWMSGVLIVILPWLARNFIVFGKLQPYAMPQSTVGVLTNFRDFVAAQISEVLGMGYIGKLAASSVLGLITVFVIIILFGWLLYKKWPLLQGIEKNGVVFAASYAAFGACLVIIARSKYQWGELISDRHTLQYATFILLAAVIILKQYSKKNLYNMVLILFVACLLFFRFLSMRDDGNITILSYSNDRSVISTINNLKYASLPPCTKNNQDLVISNYAHIYRILCDINARYPTNGYGLGGKSITEALGIVKSKVGQTSVEVRLHPGRGILATSIPLSHNETKVLNINGWDILENSSTSLVLRNGNSSYFTKP